MGIVDETSGCTVEEVSDEEPPNESPSTTMIDTTGRSHQEKQAAEASPSILDQLVADSPEQTFVSNLEELD